VRRPFYMRFCVRKIPKICDFAPKVLFAAIFAFIRDMNNQPSMDLCATVALSVFAGRIYCFARTKNRYDIIIAVITCAIAVFATIRFFMGH